MIDSLVTLLCLLGVYGFYSDNFSFLIIGCIASLIGRFIAIITGQFRGFFSMAGFIIVGIIYAIFTGIEIWMGALIGLCFEQAIMGTLGIAMLLFAVIASSKSRNNS